MGSGGDGRRRRALVAGERPESGFRWTTQEPAARAATSCTRHAARSRVRMDDTLFNAMLVQHPTRFRTVSVAGLLACALDMGVLSACGAE